jgi:predicted AlkP superfamily phosphohydrolase/phosphomutase
MKRVMVLVLDAAPPDLIEKWMADGSLPNLKRLRETGAYGRLESVAEWLAEATPYAFYSGQNPASTGLHCYTMWQKETMQARSPGKDWIPYQPFWRAFQKNGPRAIVVDPSNVYPPEPFNGSEVIGWATHDALAPFQSYPPELAGWIQSQFGSNLLPDEKYGLVSKREFMDERRTLLELNRTFKDLCLALMRREPWDLFLATNFTLHQAGHRLWSTVNIKGRLTQEERHNLDGTLHEIFMACDAAVGEIVAAAGKDVVVMVLSVHGMGVNNSRTWIFPEMIRRILGGPERSGGGLRALRQLIPVEWRHAIKSRLPFKLRRGLTRYWRISGRDWKKTRAFPLFSDTQGWVRVNLRGREALGIVEPGPEYDALCQEISEGLKSFVDADTGEPVVQDIFRPHQVFEGERLADLPDMVVRWSETPSARHRAVVSPRFGVIPWSTPGQNPEGRSGNHRSQGMLIAAGPEVESGTITDAHILDLAPTILTLLGQPVPAEMEGKPLKLGR